MFGSVSVQALLGVQATLRWPCDSTTVAPNLFVRRDRTSTAVAPPGVSSPDATRRCSFRGHSEEDVFGMGNAVVHKRMGCPQIANLVSAVGFGFVTVEI